MAQKVTSSFMVMGNCSMCQQTIEKAAKIKGVKKASWNKDTHLLYVKYNTKRVTLNSIKKNIADAGYDTDIIKASDTAYANLHTCCRYRGQ